MSLIGQGRVVLLLDGYDEMAQYLHARERRTCLEALAELAAGGARGVLTSRPNYFTEAEELRVFEILYASIKHGQYYLTPEGWRFSHNSLREFLVAEHLLDGLVSGEVVDEETPVSEAMRVFPASRPQDDRRSLLERLAGIWRRTDLRHGRGQLLSLLWDGLVPLFAKETDPSTACLTAVSGSPVALKGVNISRVALSTERFPAVLKGASFAESGLFQVDFSGADLEGADFSGATLEEVRFQAARLQYCKFIGAMLIDIEITGADVTNADFSALDPDYVSVVADDPDARSGRKRLQGMSALGYLHFKGAHTAPLPPSTIFQHDPRFPIVAKIVEKLAEQTVRQRRGLEQRGESRNDIPFARRFVSHLESKGLVRTGRKDLLEVTDRGREIFGRFVQTRELPDVLVEFLSEA